MIRGRAGVGKTTLCKKIVSEFIRGNLWQSQFDSVLWVPLRHLFLSQSMECDELAEALWRAMNAKHVRVLFILDGLDEVWSHLEGGIREFLITLLNLPDVIINSRPNAAFTADLDPPHLELETIGFDPDQVKEYIENTFTDLQTGQTAWGKVEAIQSFLDHHQLLQALVQIPIQLDAFCFTWEDFRNKESSSDNMKETITAIYQRIEQSLWRKDAERLEKLTKSSLLTLKTDISRGC